MKYSPAIYILLLSTYNLFGNNTDVRWVMFYYIVVHAMMALLFFSHASKSVLKRERNLFRVGGYFSSFYVLFHIIAFIGFADKFLKIIDTELWSGIFFIASLLILSTFWYDKKSGNIMD